MVMVDRLYYSLSAAALSLSLSRIQTCLRAPGCQVTRFKRRSISVRLDSRARTSACQFRKRRWWEIPPTAAFQSRILSGTTSTPLFLAQPPQPTLRPDTFIAYPTAKMAAKNLPAAFNATAQDIEMLLSAQCHIGSKNLQVHMEPYLWKTRPDGINVINIGKTW